MDRWPSAGGDGPEEGAALGRLQTALLPLLPGARTGPGAYIVALAFAGVVLGIDLLFQESFAETGFLTFFPVVFLAAWWGGRGPGLFATLLSTAAGIYAFQRPFFSLPSASWEQALELSLFVLTGVLIALLSDGLHAARESAEKREALAVELRQQLAGILSGVVDAIATTDTAGRIVYANQAAATLFQLPAPESVVGGRLPDLLRQFTIREESGALLSWQSLPFARAMDQGGVAQDVLKLTAPGQPDRWVVFTARPVLTRLGQLELMLLVIADISSIKIAEQEREVWMHALAHDLKSPLTVVRGYAQLALRHIADEKRDAIASALTRVMDGTDRLADMIDQLNDLARLGANGTLALHRQPCDLIALVRRSAEEAAASSSGHGVHVVAAVNELRVVADADRLRRVLDNLLSNAIKYSPSGGLITLEAGVEAGAAIISVSDQGIGIGRSDLSRIFDRFQRGSNVGRIPGTGLGLSFSQAAVRAHGGDMVVTSEPGTGTTVRVRLPLPMVEEPAVGDSIAPDVIPQPASDG